MSPPNIDDLIAQLKDGNENVRLKAANLLTKDKSPDARAAVPILKDIYLHDPNPAVKFLAKKALTNLGEDISAIQEEGQARVAELPQTPGTVGAQSIPAPIASAGQVSPLGGDPFGPTPAVPAPAPPEVGGSSGEPAFGASPSPALSPAAGGVSGEPAFGGEPSPPPGLSAVPAQPAGGPTGSQSGGILMDHDIMWKVAMDEFRPIVPSLFRLISSEDPKLLDKVSDATEKLGTVLCAAALLEAYEREQSQARKEDDGGGLEAFLQDVSDLIHIARLKHSGINPATAAAMGNLTCPEVLEAFIDMLRSNNTVLQDNAVRILSELSDPNTVEPLLRLLGSDNMRLERKVIKTVSKIVRETKTDQDLVLKSILDHFKPGESDFKLFSIVDAVGRIKTPQALKHLTDWLKHDLPRVRANAVERIAEMDLPESEKVRLLGPCLNDPNNRVLANAVAALWHSAAQDRAREVMLQCLRDDDKWVRASIAFALGEINEAETVPPLISLLKDPDPAVRRNASNSTRRLVSKQAVAKLVEYVNDDSVDVRICVVEQIGRSGIDAYNDVLHLLMIDAEAVPRLLAAVVLSLGQMKLPENIPTISYYLNEDDELIRANSVLALEAINDPKVMSLINLSITDSHPMVRATAAKAVWRFGEIGAVNVVREMVESESPEQQSHGVFALGDMAESVREKRKLATFPLLVAALRRSPRFEQLRSRVSGF